MATTRSAVLEGDERLVVREFPLPPIGADEALDPELKYSGRPVSDRAIIDACKPFPRLKTYTPTNNFSREYKREIAARWGL